MKACLDRSVDRPSPFFQSDNHGLKGDRLNVVPRII